jgi:hypothetical protein
LCFANLGPICGLRYIRLAPLESGRSLATLWLWPRCLPRSPSSSFSSPAGSNGTSRRSMTTCARRRSHAGHRERFQVAAPITSVRGHRHRLAAAHLHAVEEKSRSWRALQPSRLDIDGSAPSVQHKSRLHLAGAFWARHRFLRHCGNRLPAELTASLGRAGHPAQAEDGHDAAVHGATVSRVPIKFGDRPRTTPQKHSNRQPKLSKPANRPAASPTACRDHAMSAPRVRESRSERNVLHRGPAALVGTARPGNYNRSFKVTATCPTS